MQCALQYVYERVHHIYISIMNPAKPITSMIVAALQPKFGIGSEGGLPWKLKQEMKYFRDVTSNSKDGTINAVIMGRKTWESIPERFRPLPNRLNVILSRSHLNTEKDGVFYYNSIEAIISSLTHKSFVYNDKSIDKIFIIGGAQIYNSAIKSDFVDNLLITNIRYNGKEADAPVLDTFLDWDLSQWLQSDISLLREFANAPFAEGLIKEGDYEYEYTMWKKRA